MCGIGGVWNLDGAFIHPQEFDFFIDSLAHRGPDGRGVFKDPNEMLFFGHRRLSILDLSERAAQPMSHGGKRYWITYNGEIYNFLEVRRELEQLGHLFRSESDTEVILASYAEWGASCQYKFNGMWSFAIWDSLEKTLFLSRDRFGVKPLYYFWDGKQIAFASEIKAFTHLVKFPIEFDEQMIANALYDVNSIETTEYSLIKSIRRLKGGECALYKKGGTFLIQKWWDTLDHLPEIAHEKNDQIDQFRSLFMDACKVRLRSDVPTATALSGGLDSSSVLAAITHIRSQNERIERTTDSWQQVYCAKFPNTTQDESIYAKQMVEYTKTSPIFCELNPSYLIQNIDTIIYDLEEIFDLPLGPWELYRQMRKKGTVISIDGHGPDEFLGGYHHLVEIAIADALFPKLNMFRAKELNSILNCMYPDKSPMQRSSYSSFFRRAFLDKLREFPFLYKSIRSGFRMLGWGKGLQKSWLKIEPESRYYTHNHPRFKSFGFFEKSLYIDFHLRTLPTILRNFDRCSMAHGVEIRAPFLDWRLVSFAFGLSKDMKIGKDGTKLILREAMKGLLPETIRKRSAKIGFASPMHEWLKSDLKSFMLDHLQSRSFQSSNIWDGTQILSAALASYKTGDMKGVRTAWEFVQANRLMQLFKSRTLKKTAL